jgi:hypothetical protein
MTSPLCIRSGLIVAMVAAAIAGTAGCSEIGLGAAIPPSLPPEQRQ